MFYEKELLFLCDTLKKMGVKTKVMTARGFDLSFFDIENISKVSEDDELSVSRFFGNTSEKTLYKMTDIFMRGYSYLLLPGETEQTLFFVGPYLHFPVFENDIPEIGERNLIPPKNQRHLSEYYSSLPVLPDSSPVFIMLDTFCEKIWQSQSFSVVDVNKEKQLPASPINNNLQNESFDDILADMKALEKRYAFENEMLKAVEHGQIHKEKYLISAFYGNHFEKRSSDALRNAKNYSIIMNTLLRKAAESGGVHPIYIDSTSSAFAIKIEHVSSLAENSDIMREMFRDYCRLVRRHSMKNFSLIVQKTIMLIEKDLSAELSPSLIAENQNLSLGYLSTVFKRETGQTITEYIREKRMKHAEHLLVTTRLQIQTIALHCGIMDVQYFSKTFKKYSGMTPKEYRDTANNLNKN